MRFFLGVAAVTIILALSATAWFFRSRYLAAEAERTQLASEQQAAAQEREELRRDNEECAWYFMVYRNVCGHLEVEYYPEEVPQPDECGPVILWRFRAVLYPPDAAPLQPYVFQQPPPVQPAGERLRPDT